MGDKSKIEWTEATWNPTVGCSVISPGCTNCYAMKMAARIELMSKNSVGGEKMTHYVGVTKKTKAGAVWTGKLAMAPEHIMTWPLRCKRPRMIFVNSMGDLFHESVPDEWIDQVFAVMALASQHTFQVLTKRAERMRAFMSNLHKAVTVMQARLSATEEIARIDQAQRFARAKGERTNDLVEEFPHMAGALAHPSLDWKMWPLPNIWLGVSAEDQKRADERIPHLLHTPAAVRFVSAEPLLDEINLQKIALGTCDATFYGHPEIKHAAFFMDALRGVNKGAIPPLDWIIVGGESGPNARPMHPDWARSIRDQCQTAGVPYFFKQWGEHAPNGSGRYSMIKVGKRAAGRLLDGREHNEMPERADG